MMALLLACALLGLAGLLIFALVGAFTFFHLLRGKKAPADASNRINHVRLWWFALTREDLFVGTFKWLTRDELDNTKGTG